jgi:FKBP-type peptidyl-prolyl cis-trans isomerase FklB
LKIQSKPGASGSRISGKSVFGNTGVLAYLGLALFLAGCDQSAIAESETTKAEGDSVALDSEVKEASYLLGFKQIEDLLQQTDGVIDADAYLQGAKDFVGDKSSQVSDADQQRVFTALQAAVGAKQAEASAGVREAGDAFRAEYAMREGVTQLPSGLLYEVITEGSGPKPTASDTVTTHYHGTLVDGTVFDSSVERGQPASFPVNGVIAGWTEALQLMNTGSKWRLVVPSDLAYGDRGAGGQIKPGATLIFEVELLEIN